VRKSLWAFLLVFLAGCGPQTFFYYPNRILYDDPARLNIRYETVSYPSLDGKTIYALFFPSRKKPQGTVVFFHGNFGNVSNHFGECLFLIGRGFDVLIFDYEGYGASEGRPTPKRTFEDGIASVRYIHNRNPNLEIAAFGQSLGGAVATVVAAKEPLVKAVVIEASFTSYRAMARTALKRSFLTWLLFPIVPLFLNHDFDPIDFIASISPRPILMIHGDHDKTVPSFMSEQLFEKAQEPKRLWMIPGADHLTCRRVAGKEYDDKVVEFLTQALTDSPTVKDKDSR